MDWLFFSCCFWRFLFVCLFLFCPTELYRTTGHVGSIDVYSTYIFTTSIIVRRFFLACLVIVVWFFCFFFAWLFVCVCVCGCVCVCV